MHYRIVSTSPDITEILCALNLFEDLVGVSRFCSWPPEVRIIPKVSDLVKVDGPALEEARPDIVVTSTDLQREIVETATARHLRVVALHPYNLQSLFDNIRLLGDLFGRQFEAGDLVSRMKREFLAIRAKGESLARRPRVFCEESGDPIVVAIGWVQEIIEIAGGQPLYPRLVEVVAASRRTIEASELRRKNPEIALVAWRGWGGRIDERVLEARPGWSEIDAVRNGRVYPVNDALYLQPGPRLVHGAREIHRIIQSLWCQAP